MTSRNWRNSAFRRRDAMPRLRPPRRTRCTCLPTSSRALACGRTILIPTSHPSPPPAKLPPCAWAAKATSSTPWISSSTPTCRAVVKPMPAQLIDEVNKHARNACHVRRALRPPPGHRTTFSALYPLEMRDWATASACSHGSPALSTGFDFGYWAKAIGNAHRHMPEEAHKDVAAIAAITSEVRWRQKKDFADAIRERSETGPGVAGARRRQVRRGWRPCAPSPTKRTPSGTSPRASPRAK